MGKVMRAHSLLPLDFINFSKNSSISAKIVVPSDASPNPGDATASYSTITARCSIRRYRAKIYGWAKAVA